jgi:hypothetical protein
MVHETRLKMLWLLMGREELCVCDIMGVLQNSPGMRIVNLSVTKNLVFSTG